MISGLGSVAGSSQPQVLGMATAPSADTGSVQGGSGHLNIANFPGHGHHQRNTSSVAAYSRAGSGTPGMGGSNSALEAMPSAQSGGLPVVPPPSSSETDSVAAARAQGGVLPGSTHTSGGGPSAAALAGITGGSTGQGPSGGGIGGPATGPAAFVGTCQTIDASELMLRKMVGAGAYGKVSWEVSMRAEGAAQAT